MTAAVIELSAYVARRGGDKSRASALDTVSTKTGHDRPSDIPQVSTNSEQNSVPKFDFCFWQGATGERYVHHVYGLIDCPQVPAANYILFGHAEDGSRRVLHVGMVTHEAPSLNLAEIRHRGATLGAREVHVHVLGTTDGRRAAIEMDLRAGLGVDCDTGVLSA